MSLSALARLGFEEPEAAVADLERLGAWPPAAAPGCTTPTTPSRAGSDPMPAWSSRSVASSSS